VAGVSDRFTLDSRQMAGDDTLLTVIAHLANDRRLAVAGVANQTSVA